MTVITVSRDTIEAIVAEVNRATRGYQPRELRLAVAPLRTRVIAWSDYFAVETAAISFDVDAASFASIELAVLGRAGVRTHDAPNPD